MGCDGGTIPKRDELVRTKKKPEQKDKQSELSFKWGHCSITQEPLQTPIVACQLGRLYSKVAVIESILDRTTLPDGYKHIKNLRDVKELQLTDNPAYKDAAKKGDSYEDNVAPYICPVIGLEMNGRFRFVFLWSCGCVVSERAIKQIKSDGCHKCQKPFNEEDVVVLNGTDEDVDLLKTRMEARQARIKAEKKLKKIGASTVQNGCAPSTSTCADGAASGSGSGSGPASASTSKLNNMTKNDTNGKIKSESSKLSNVTTKMNGHSSKLPMKRSLKTGLEDPVFKKTKGDYSVAKDPKATEVFKSLFTSHKSAETQNRAHWVTYNPFYN